MPKYSSLSHKLWWFSKPDWYLFFWTLRDIQEERAELYNKIKVYKSPELYAIRKFNDWMCSVGRQENSWENNYSAKNLYFSAYRAPSYISCHVTFKTTLWNTNYLSFTSEDKALIEWLAPCHWVVFQSGQYADSDRDLCLRLLFLLWLAATQDSGSPTSVWLLFSGSFLPGPFLSQATCWSPCISPTDGVPYQLPWRLPTATIHPSTPSAFRGSGVPLFWGQRTGLTHEDFTS